MKEVMEFDFEQFVSRMKELNQRASVEVTSQEEDEEKRHYMVIGWYNCLEAVIKSFKECMD